jgi:hypothetical protein
LTERCPRVEVAPPIGKNVAVEGQFPILRKIRNVNHIHEPDESEAALSIFADDLAEDRPQMLDVRNHQ